MAETTLGTSTAAETPGPLGRLDDLPRARLGHVPTPIEAMPNLGARLGADALYVKRDDCTGLAFGGNKVRQLEFYLGDAVAQAADTILITGAVQSNFARLAAAGARKLGMDCHIQLEERVPKTDPLYRNSGNVLLDRLLGATLHTYPGGEDEAGADAHLREIAAGLEAQGRRPYVIPLAPGHAPLGALGYVDAAREILAQAAAQDLAFDEIVVSSGSGHTHGGLLFGLRALGCPARVTGICVRRPAAAQRPRIESRCREIAELLEAAPVVAEDDVHLTDEFLAPGYGQLNPATVEAIELAARTEALILDPVYTGKTMAGFIQRARGRSRTDPDDPLVAGVRGRGAVVLARASAALRRPATRA
ncbi:MAG: D-cysteine desulfhydrase family protein [Proteobacteria bacterium]|nr:D-cysteine desulfhydrase family protein [Pseudomonadota bacterium]